VNEEMVESIIKGLALAMVTIMSLLVVAFVFIKFKMRKLKKEIMAKHGLTEEQFKEHLRLAGWEQ
jgi:predicted transcriptional regulator